MKIEDNECFRYSYGMKTKHLARRPGIYIIRNNVNEKFYVGSACDLQVRAHQHARNLRLGCHPNPKLQSSWSKNGSDAFRIEVLELVEDKANLISREQLWIDRLRASEVGYNIRSVAESNLGIKWSAEVIAKLRVKKLKKFPGFIDPNGIEMSVIDAPLFAKRVGIPLPAVSALALGKICSCKGWTHVNAKSKERLWIKTHDGFIDPGGIPVPPFENLQAFCRDRGLDAASMNRLARGKVLSVKGWTHASARPRRRRTQYEGKEIVGFVGPDGQPRTIRNLKRFCRENGLDEGVMHGLRRGKHLSHKGWTYPASIKPRGPKAGTVHAGFVNPQGAPVTIVDMVNYCRENGLSTSAMSRLRLGQCERYKGWAFRPC